MAWAGASVDGVVREDLSGEMTLELSSQSCKDPREEYCSQEEC